MARKPKLTDVLKSSPADETLRKICAWHQTDNPPPDELRQWVNQEKEMFKKTVVFIDANIEAFRQLSEVKRMETFSIRDNSVDFVERAEVADKILDGLSAGRVSDAFVEGVRIGMLHRTIWALVKGHYADLWEHQGGRQRGALATNEKKAKERPDYRSEVKSLMDSGMLYTPACEQVAQSHDVTRETVRNWTPDLRPRKPKAK